MTTDAKSDLKRRYEAAFYPSFRHQWESERARWDWVDLEPSIDALAGPLYSIVETGGCAYVYPRDDERFTGVDGPDTLREWLRHRHDRLMEAIDRFVPTSPAEAADLASMRHFAADMWAFTEEACDIEHARWAAAKG